MTATIAAPQRAGEPQPAQDLYAEQCVLGAMLLSATACGEVLELLEQHDLYSPKHADIFACIVDVHRRGDPADPVTVGAELRRSGRLAHIGGLPYLHTLIATVPTPAGATAYAEIVAELATTRRLDGFGQRARQLATLPAGGDIGDVLAKLQSELAVIATTHNRSSGSRLVSGGAFIHDVTDEVPAVWGHGDEVLWAEGEPLMLTGPTGVGKTTIAGQLVAARLGITDSALGFPVAPGRRLLYLAMDRPSQIRRALRRRFRNQPRELLDERLVVWQGPPPADLAREPERLLALAREAGADTVVIDSLKDAALKLSDEESGQGVNRAFQYCVAEGVEVLALHHQRKAGASGQGSKPNSISDVYGSTWITAGCGSILLLWGSAGDLVVELSHLKQPAAAVGPLKLTHNPEAGTSTVHGRVEVRDLLDATPRTVREIALAVSGTDQTPTDSVVERTRRALDRLVKECFAAKYPAGPGAPATYVRLSSGGVTAGVTHLFGDGPAEGSRGVTP